MSSTTGVSASGGEASGGGAAASASAGAASSSVSPAMPRARARKRPASTTTPEPESAPSSIDGQDAARSTAGAASVPRWGVSPRVHAILANGGAAAMYASVFVLLMFQNRLVMRLMGGGTRQPRRAPMGVLAVVSLTLWLLHFARRCFEAGYIHKFSRPRVPLKETVRVVLYLWVFAGLLAWTVSKQHRGIGSRALFESPLVLPGFLVFVVGECGNFAAHIVLANLRRKIDMSDLTSRQSQLRFIPHRFAFRWISHPHYLFEMISWVGFNLVTRTTVGWVFAAMGIVIMVAQAHAKHHADREHYGPVWPKDRKILIPYVW